MEIGKQYVPRSVKQSTPMTCVYVTPNKNSLRTAVLQYPNGAEYAVEQGKWPFYVEYKEPRSLKRYMVVYENGDGDANTSFYYNEEHPDLKAARRDQKLWNMRVLDIVEINWVEKNV